MNTENHSQTAAFLWSIADLLRGDFKQSQYGRIILPFTLLRKVRIEAGADSLMALGCGRLFEGDAAMMWQSLSRLAALPPDKARARRAEQRELLDRLDFVADPHRRAVVERAGPFLDFGGQRTAQRHIHFLDAPADSK